MNTTFNTEMNKQIRELTADEIAAVSGGITPEAFLAVLTVAGILAGAVVLDSVGGAINWQGAAARGHW